MLDGYAETTSTLTKAIIYESYAFWLVGAESKDREQIIVEKLPLLFIFMYAVIVGALILNCVPVKHHVFGEGVLFVAKTKLNKIGKSRFLHEYCK